MIINPYRFSSAGSMSFVSSIGPVYTSTGTTINSPITPSGIANGDGVFAIVMARSSLTPPLGWTLVDSQSNNDPGTGTTQTVYVYRKDTVTSGDSSTSFTWTQSSSGRMGLAYLVVRSSTGIIFVAETDSVETDAPSGSSFNVSTPVLAATANSELFIMATNAISASAINDTWTAPSGATMRTQAVIVQNRLAAATQSRNAGQSNSSPFTFTQGSGTNLNYFGSVSIRLQAI